MNHYTKKDMKIIEQKFNYFALKGFNPLATYENKHLYKLNQDELIIKYLL